MNHSRRHTACARPQRTRGHAGADQRGAALLLAMVAVTLAVAALTAVGAQRVLAPPLPDFGQGVDRHHAE